MLFSLRKMRQIPTLYYDTQVDMLEAENYDEWDT